MITVAKEGETEKDLDARTPVVYSLSRLNRTTVNRTSRVNRTEFGGPGETRNTGWPRYA